MKTVGVIVTYNRKGLLVNNIDMLLKQTKKLDNLIIIDNDSNDGTYEFLRDKHYLDDNWIIYEKLLCNTGGAGGFYHGTKSAFEKGYDYIWLMDDDGKPYNEDTFEKIYNIANIVYVKNRQFLINCLVTINGVNLSFPLGISNDIRYEETIIQSKLKLGENLILNKANPFNGTLISKETVEKVGYPAKEFFISCDEVDYFHRCLENHVFIGTAIQSMYYHPASKFKFKKFFKWRLAIYPELTREYYFIRNKAYSLISRHKMRFMGIVILRLIVIILYENKKNKRIKQIYRAIMDARSGKMGEYNRKA